MRLKILLIYATTNYRRTAKPRCEINTKKNLTNIFKNNIIFKNTKKRKEAKISKLRRKAEEFSFYETN